MELKARAKNAKNDMAMEPFMPFVKLSLPKSLTQSPLREAADDDADIKR